LILELIAPVLQLFNITADPMELHELSTLAAHEHELKIWRGRMVAQFEQEKRGALWVQVRTMKLATKNAICANSVWLRACARK